MGVAGGAEAAVESELALLEDRLCACFWLRGRASFFAGVGAGVGAGVVAGAGDCTEPSIQPSSEDFDEGPLIQPSPSIDMLDALLRSEDDARSATGTLPSGMRSRLEVVLSPFLPFQRPDRSRSTISRVRDALRERLRVPPEASARKAGKRSAEERLRRGVELRVSGSAAW